MIQGFAHVALYTDKFDETIRFYEEAFDAVSNGVFALSNRGCWLTLGGDILEIFEGEALPAEGAFKHIALSCDDVDAAYEKALRCGGKPMVTPNNIEIPMPAPKALRIAFVTGVNGEQIELCGPVK